MIILYIAPFYKKNNGTDAKTNATVPNKTDISNTKAPLKLLICSDNQKGHIALKCGIGRKGNIHIAPLLNSQNIYSVLSSYVKF